MMQTLPERILDLVQKSPGLTDREITDHLSGRAEPQQPVNMAARRLEKQGKLARRKRGDGLIGNYYVKQTMKPVVHDSGNTGPAKHVEPHNELSEDALKQILEYWLNCDGWACDIAWGKRQGIDVLAVRGSERWIIEVKGIGSLNAMRVNYFLAILGETLQRMDDPNAKYSIALPDVPQFRRLWERLPKLAKQRTGITAIFVSSEGGIAEAS